MCDSRGAATIFDLPANGLGPASAFLGVEVPKGCQVVPGHGVGCGGDGASKDCVVDLCSYVLTKKWEERYV